MAAFADSNYVIPETLGLSMKSAQVAIAVNAFVEENYCDSPVTPVVFEVGPYYTQGRKKNTDKTVLLSQTLQDNSCFKFWS